MTDDSGLLRDRVEVLERPVSELSHPAVSHRREPRSGRLSYRSASGPFGPRLWERINRVLMEEARGGKVEGGRTVRIDSTVTETHIRKPTDSQLLCDGVRVLTRFWSLRAMSWEVRPSRSTTTAGRRSDGR